MASNFVVAAVGFRVGKGGLPKTATSELRKKMFEAVDKEIDWVEFDNLLDAPTESIVTCRKIAKNYIRTFFGLLHAKTVRLDFAILTIGGNPWVVSGGETWGDDPTTVFTAILEFTRLPNSVLEAGKVILEG